MRDFLTVIKIALIGLFVAVIAYPLVHEGGHILATALTGGKLICLSWLPVPNVLCEVNISNNAALAVTSLAGMILPMIFILPFFKSKGFLRFGVLVFNMITILSAVIGLSVSFLRLNNTVIPNDDVTAFIDFTGWMLPTVFIMSVLTVITILQLFLLKPKSTFLNILDTAQIVKRKVKVIPKAKPI